MPITALEIQNAAKVLPMLVDIDGLKVDQTREDIFVVTECSTGNNLSIVVDVEPTTVCLMMEIMDVPGDATTEFFQYLLELNAQAVHGKFSITNGKVILRENLQVENLDQNEIEKALEHMFLVAARNFREILRFGGIIVNDSDFEYGDESDLDEIDIEDIAMGTAMVADTIIDAMNDGAAEEGTAEETEVVTEAIEEEAIRYSPEPAYEAPSYESSSDSSYDSGSFDSGDSDD